jgi:hypothetical protein
VSSILPIHGIFLGPDRYDWSFADEAMAEIRRLGLIPILDLLHFGVPDWISDFQNPELPSSLRAGKGRILARFCDTEPCQSFFAKGRYPETGEAWPSSISREYQGASSAPMRMAAPWKEGIWQSGLALGRA